MDAMVLNVNVQPLYDTSFIPTAGTTGVTFFATPIGQGVSSWNTGSTKNQADTNMTTAATLPAGYNFQILGFRLLPSFNMTIADATLAINGAAFIFSIGSQDFLTVPARTVPAGAGQFIGGAGATTTAGWGMPTIQNGFKIAAQPLTLSQSQNFGARLVWSLAVAVTTTITGGAAGLPITCLLDGVLARRPQ